MSVSSILSSGLQSMQAAINRTDAASSRVAALGSANDHGALAGSMVALSQGAIDAKLAANVIKTGNEILGTMIDLRT